MPITSKLKRDCKKEKCYKCKHWSKRASILGKCQCVENIEFLKANPNTHDSGICIVRKKLSHEVDVFTNPHFGCNYFEKGEKEVDLVPRIGVKDPRMAGIDFYSGDQYVGSGYNEIVS